MRKTHILSTLILISFCASFGYSKNNNDKNIKPEIIGQKLLRVNQGQSITIQLTDLYVADADNNYPADFTLELFNGNNYTRSGNTITPFTNFFGSLAVQVRVNDGKDDSRRYDLKINVDQISNQPPVITTQVPLTINQSQSLTILLSDVTVVDSDNSYPSDFTLSTKTGVNYSVTNNTITPSPNFEGTLSVPITVNDGQNTSAVFNLKIEVLSNNDVPKIVGQVVLRTNEDEAISIKLSHLTVSDNDDTYPTDFKLTVLNGENYTLSGNNVMPKLNFNGILTIPVTVNDGTNESQPYNFVITVNAVNDPPIITIESEYLVYKISDSLVYVTPQSTVADVDDDTLSIAEIKFDKTMYEIGKDELFFTNTENIRGVFDHNEGILSLIGRASVTDYQNAMRSVQYNYYGINSEATNDKKTIIASITDGRNISAPAHREINFGNTVTDLDIPTGFTPNGDLVNDTWNIKPLNTDGITNPVIRVYSKRGQLVYEAAGFENEWDGVFHGEFLPADTYFYTIDLNLPNAKAKYNGLVTILR